MGIASGSRTVPLHELCQAPKNPSLLTPTPPNLLKGQGILSRIRDRYSSETAVLSMIIPENGLDVKPATPFFAIHNIKRPDRFLLHTET